MHAHSSQIWTRMNLRHHAAARPHLMQKFEEQMKMETKENKHSQSPESIQDPASAGTTSSLAGITSQPADDRGKVLLGDTQTEVPEFNRPEPGGDTSLGAVAQPAQHETLSHNRPIHRSETAVNDDDRHLDGCSDDEPPGSPQSSIQERLDWHSDEDETKQQLGVAKGKQRAEPKPEGPPLSDLFEGHAEIQQRPMNSLFYDDSEDDYGSDISDERAVPPPARPFKRVRSDSPNQLLAEGSGGEAVPRGLKRIKSEPVEGDLDELLYPDSDGEGDDDDDASSPRQRTFDAKERRHQRGREKQIQIDIQELDGGVATIERLYHDRKIMKLTDLNAQTLEVLKKVSAKKWHYLKEVIEAGKLEQMLFSMIKRKKTYDENTRDMANMIRDTFEQRFEGRSVFKWEHNREEKVMMRCGYANIAQPRGSVGGGVNPESADG